MSKHAKRIAVVIGTLARPQGGVARITVQGVVVVLATGMALCTGRLSLRDPGGEEALLPATQTTEIAGKGSRHDPPDHSRSPRLPPLLPARRARLRARKVARREAS